MKTNLTTINKHSKLVLSKAKNLIDVTNKLLSKKDIDSVAVNFKFKPYFIESCCGSVGSVIISPDSKAIISGSGNNTIRIWDMQSGECLNTLNYDSYLAISSIEIKSDGKTFIFYQSEIIVG